MRRMDRYNEETNHLSRMDKNQQLYQNVSSNTIYTNITDVTHANAFEINNMKSQTPTSHTTREAYHRMQKYQNVETIPHSEKELDDFNYAYQRKENKIYDINSVLEEARKNRQEKDEKDEKRKLKNNAYNILSGMNKEELEKYREEKKKRMTTPEEDELRELIDTIASKTLAGEIDKATSVDLLSDLMATNMLDKVGKMSPDEVEEKELTAEQKEEKEESREEKEEKDNNTTEIPKTEEQEKKDEQESEKAVELKEKDPDFYTRSMDLSDKDFELSDEFKEKPLPLFVKIIIFLLIVVIIGIAAYFVYLRIR